MQLEPLDTREIGKRLRTLLTNARMKQVELSSLLGIAQSTLSLYERGGIIPGFEILIAYMKLFHVSLEHLLCLDADGFDLSVIPGYDDLRYGAHKLNANEKEQLMTLLSTYK